MFIARPSGRSAEAFFALLPEPPVDAASSAWPPPPPGLIECRRKRGQEWDDLLGEVGLAGGFCDKPQHRAPLSEREKAPFEDRACPRSPQKVMRVSRDYPDREERFLGTPQEGGRKLGCGVAVGTPSSQVAGTPKPQADIETPKARREIAYTPPSGPAMLQKRLRDDIEAALARSSVPLLSLAFSRSHCCGEDHSLHEAVRQQNVRALRLLLRHAGPAQVDAHCRGRRPLHDALQLSMEGDVGDKIAEVLLASGASPDFCDGDDPSLGSPLHLAAKRGNASMVALLMAYGADANLRDADGRTPLHMCCKQIAFEPCFVEEEVANMLLSAGASPVAVDALGLQPSDYAQGVALKRLLQHAARQWGRRELALATGPRGGCQAAGSVAAESGGGPAQDVPWVLPEIFEAVASCM